MTQNCGRKWLPYYCTWLTPAARFAVAVRGVPRSGSPAHLLQPAVVGPRHSADCGRDGVRAAGGAYVPSMCEVIIVRHGHSCRSAFGWRPSVKTWTIKRLAGPDGQRSGVVDHIAENDEDCLRWFDPSCQSGGAASAPIHSPPRGAGFPRKMLGLIPADARVQSDVREVIARLVDAMNSTSSKGSTALLWSPGLPDRWLVCRHRHL